MKFIPLYAIRLLFWDVMLAVQGAASSKIVMGFDHNADVAPVFLFDFGFLAPSVWWNDDGSDMIKSQNAT
jgi:hypothetical protein